MKRIFALMIALMMSACTIGTALAESTAPIADKEEVVYANLLADGQVDSIYVVNQFVLNAGGTIRDYGSYAEVRNLTSTAAIDTSGGVTTVSADKGNFYYQGNMDEKKLPWIVSIDYELDGTRRAAEEIAGKSGDLAIRIRTSADLSFHEAFHAHYMLQITVTLDGDICTEIAAPGATIANAGKNKTIAFTALPDQNGDFIVRASVQRFAMGGIQIVAMPFSMDVKDAIDTESFQDQLLQLQDGIAQLHEGTSELASGTLQLRDGIAQLEKGSGGVESGLGSLSKGAAELSKNSGSILSGIEQLSGGLDQLRAAGSALKNGSGDLTTGLEAIAGGLNDMDQHYVVLLQGASALYGTIDNLHTLAQSMSGDIATLKKLLGVLDGYPEIQNDFGKYIGAGKSLIGIAETLTASLGAAKAGYKEILDGLEAVGVGLSQMNSGAAGLNAGLSAYVNGTNQFVDGVLSVDASALAENYALFDEGLDGVAGGLDTLHSNYGLLQDSLGQLHDGMSELADGTGELADGTGTMKEETSDIDTRVQEEIDSALEKFDGSGFTPISFTDERNTVSLVQFILQTKAIEASEPVVVVREEVQEETFLKRLIGLFSEEEAV